MWMTVLRDSPPSGRAMWQMLPKDGGRALKRTACFRAKPSGRLSATDEESRGDCETRSRDGRRPRMSADEVAGKTAIWTEATDAPRFWASLRRWAQKPASGVDEKTALVQKRMTDREAARTL